MQRIHMLSSHTLLMLISDTKRDIHQGYDQQTTKEDNCPENSEKI